MDTPWTAPETHTLGGERRLHPASRRARWWAYRRPPVPPDAPSGSVITTPRSAAHPSEPPVFEPLPPPADRATAPSGQPAAVLAAGLVVMTIFATRALGNESLGPFLLPAA